jgi:excinuclease ABC subunit C
MIREDLSKFDLPEEPGIYRFQKGGKVLYVGKATSLKDRVRSYFATDLADARSTAIVAMVSQADTLTWETTDSVLEALILEANTIKKLEPQFNILEKNNRSFNYLIITNEKFPKLLVMRGREYFSNWQGGKVKEVFGPFPQGAALREAMKLVRRIFPYRDEKCVPCEEQLKGGKAHCRPCFNRQIGLCPGTCTGEVDAAQYGRIVRNICLLFSGKKKALLKELERDMKRYSKEERFEEAESARRQAGALTHIRDISLIKDESRIATGGKIEASGSRIEAYDIAHTGGTETVGVMVAVEDNEPLKSAYRKFKVKGFTNNDPGALSEVLSRRLLHPEWQYPRVIVVDGSTAQMNAAKRILSHAGIMIPVVGVVKNERHRPERLIGNLAAIEAHERDILLANNEAHRFAINFHRKRRRVTMV